MVSLLSLSYFKVKTNLYLINRSDFIHSVSVDTYCKTSSDVTNQFMSAVNLKKQKKIHRQVDSCHRLCKKTAYKRRLAVSDEDVSRRVISECRSLVSRLG